MTFILPYLIGVGLALQPADSAGRASSKQEQAKARPSAGKGAVPGGTGPTKNVKQTRARPGPRPDARPSAGPIGPATRAPAPVAKKPDTGKPAKKTERPGEDQDDEELEGKSDEDILKSLEKEVDADPKAKKKRRAPSGKVQRIFQSLNPDVSAIGTIVFGYFYDHVLKGKGNPVPRGGHDPGKTGVHLQEVELALQAEVDPYFRFDAFLSFAQFGVELEEAYFTSLALPAKLQLRLGQMYHKFGRHNQQHLHTFDFVDNMKSLWNQIRSVFENSISNQICDFWDIDIMRANFSTGATSSTQIDNV